MRACLLPVVVGCVAADPTDVAPTSDAASESPTLTADTGPPPEKPGHVIRHMSFGAYFGYDSDQQDLVGFTDFDGRVLPPFWFVEWGSEGWAERCVSVRFLDSAAVTRNDEADPYRWSLQWPSEVDGTSDCAEAGFDLGFFADDDPVRGAFDPYTWWTLAFGGPVPDTLWDWTSFGPTDPLASQVVGTYVQSNRIYYGGENTYMWAFEVDEDFVVQSEDDVRITLAPDSLADPKSGLPIDAMYAFTTPWWVNLR